MSMAGAEYVRKQHEEQKFKEENLRRLLEGKALIVKRPEAKVKLSTGYWSIGKGVQASEDTEWRGGSKKKGGKTKWQRR